MGILLPHIMSASLANVGFLHDANTLWWDFTYSGNTVEATGDDTLAVVVERFNRVANLAQPTKDFQPISGATGANFNKDTGRQMSVTDVTGITNGKTGWYLACNANFTTADSNVMSIARNVSSTAARGEIYLTSSRNFALKAASNDGGTIAFVGYTSPLTLAQWYTLEMLFEVVGGVGELTIWVDGVEQTLAVDNNPAFVNFPATDPSEITVGNHSSTDADSMDGVLQHLIFQNGVPSASIRGAISAYLIGVRP